MLVIDGSALETAAEFHRMVRGYPGVPDWYGMNNDALLDTIRGLVGRPFGIVWFNSAISQVRLGTDFEKIVATLRFAEQEDAETEAQTEKFRLRLIPTGVDFVPRGAS